MGNKNISLNLHTKANDLGLFNSRCVVCTIDIDQLVTVLIPKCLASIGDGTYSPKKKKMVMRHICGKFSIGSFFELQRLSTRILDLNFADLNCDIEFCIR